MNIFVLDRNPVLAAKMQCDQHVVKMVLETAQLLCSAIGEGAPYKRTHYNHPCSVWARDTRGNFLWLLSHGFALADEYKFRFHRTHASQPVLEWCETYTLSGFEEMTPFAQAMPEEFRGPDPVLAYRSYYKARKSGFARWAHERAPPDWW